MGGGLDRGTEDSRLAADAEALRQLEEQGADLSAPLTTVHTLAFDSAEQAEAAATELEGSGYTVTASRAGDGIVALEASKDLVLDSSSITEERHTIEAVMDAYGGGYESGAIGSGEIASLPITVKPTSDLEGVDDAALPITVKPTGDLEGGDDAASIPITVKPGGDLEQGGLAGDYDRGEDPRGEPIFEPWETGQEDQSSTTDSNSSSDGSSSTYQVRDDLVINPETLESARVYAEETSDDSGTATVDASRIASADLTDPRLAQPGDLPYEVDVTAAAPDGSTIDRTLTGATGEAITGSTSQLSGDIQSRLSELGGDALAGSKLDPLGLTDMTDATGDVMPASVDATKADKTSLYSAGGGDYQDTAGDQVINALGGALGAATNDTVGIRSGPGGVTISVDGEKIGRAIDEIRNYPENKLNEYKEDINWDGAWEAVEGAWDAVAGGDDDADDETYENPDAVDQTPTPTADELAEAVARAESRGGTTQPSTDENEYISGGSPEMVMSRDDLVTMPAGDGSEGSGDTRTFLGSNPVINPTDPEAAQGWAAGGGYSGEPTSGGVDSTPTEGGDGTGTASYAMTGSDSGGENDDAAPSPVGGGGQIYSAVPAGEGSADEGSSQEPLDASGMTTSEGSGTDDRQAAYEAALAGGSGTYQVRDDLVINPEVYDSQRTAASDTSTTIDATRVESSLGDVRDAEPGELPHEVDVTAAAPDGTTLDQTLTSATGDAITGSAASLTGDIAARAETLGGDALSGSRLDPLGLTTTADTTDATPAGVDAMKADRTSLYSAPTEPGGAPKTHDPTVRDAEDVSRADWLIKTLSPTAPAERAGGTPAPGGGGTVAPDDDAGGDEEDEEEYENPDAVDSTPTPTAEELADAVEKAETRGGTTQPSGDTYDIVGGDPELIKQRDELVSTPVEDAGGEGTRDYLGSAPVVNPTGGSVDSSSGDAASSDYLAKPKSGTPADLVSSSGDDSPPPDDGPPPDDDSGPAGPPDDGGGEDPKWQTLAADDITGSRSVDLATSERTTDLDLAAEPPDKADGAVRIDMESGQRIEDDDALRRGDDLASAEPAMKIDGEAILDMDSGQRADFGADDPALEPAAEDANLGEEMELRTDGD